MSTEVEVIEAGGRALAYVVRAGGPVERTRFLTPDSAPLQVGYVVYPKGGAVKPHAHLPIQRTLRGTGEVIIVQRGRCEVDVFDDARVRVATRTLGAQDIVIFLDGGHAFRMLEDTVLLEVKQGPYGGPAEKAHFDPA
jgi:hypothetical protein